MTIFLSVIAVTVIAIIIGLAMQPAAYEVVRRRVIKAKPETVYAQVLDLTHWPEWNPWFMHEPDAKLTYSDATDTEGAWYRWQGDFIGAGKMTHRQLIDNESIEQALVFQKPMKSQSDVYWRFSPVGDHTEVTWGMRGKMPFFLRWMSKLMDQWVGKDYEIGLKRLATSCGDDEGAFEIEFPGTVEVPSEFYLATHYVGPIDEIPAAMRDGFPRVLAAMAEHGMTMAAAPFALYHEFDMKKKMVICDIAVPVDQVKEVPGFVCGSLPTQIYARTLLRGDYQHLEHAWFSAFSHARMYKQKIQMGKPMVERYLTDPADHAGLALVTAIDLPLK